MSQGRDPRIAKAFSAMRSLGIDAETVKPVLKRLLKLYNKKWELIEEDNYRTLADAIFECEDDKRKAERDEDMINEDIEPPCKKLHRGDPKDQVSTRDKGKVIADLEEGEVTKSSCRVRMPESPQAASRDPANEPHSCVSELPSGSKCKCAIQIHLASNEKNSSTQPASSAHYVNHELDDPDSLDHRNRNAIVPWEKQPINSSCQVIDVANGYKKRVFHKIIDITKGTENVTISLLDEIGNESLPHFVYCPENITYESAYVHVSLARIADEDCCPDCVGDCLSSSIPCACARDTGGEFAYTPEGLLNEKFLKSCISMKVRPERQHMFYCQVCPLQRAKNLRRPGKCKGHVLKKFIKECWRKCGCNMQCGNRVVQRGITRKLQVFLTGEGKGWGLRTLEELPEGAFVCEYIGEILTNIELYERNKKSSGEDKHVYPVLLDADWATEGTLKDEDALCLDATRYGNVARFINHQCHDGNLIDIPVQVETPDRHYYHLAFFTTRKVNALEELTWDYKIDFDDHNHPIKAFQCRCGSKYCRDKKGKT